MSLEILQGVNVCNLCGSENSSLLFKGNIGKDIGSRFSQYAYYDDIYRCNDCRFVAQRQRYDLESIKGFLQDEKYLDEAIGNLNLVEKQVQFDVLTQIMKKYCSLAEKELLDVGANTGVFLSTIIDQVKSGRGIEASNEAAAAARDLYNLDVQVCLIKENQFPDEEFDIITMFDVIEHLTNPMDDLGVLFKKLKPDGKIFITTHDIETWLAKVLGPQYPMLMYQHFFHFSPKTLSRMLQLNGFKVIGFERFYKSWSFGYIYNLIEKKWPGTKWANFFKGILYPLYKIGIIRRFRIVSPQRDFFIMVAEKNSNNNFSMGR